MRLELVKSTDALRGAESKNEGRDKSDAENREKLRASEERCADINRRLGDVAAEKEQLQMMVVDLEGKLRNLEIEVKNAEFQVKNAEFQKTAEREKQEAEEEADRYKRLAMKKEEEISALRVETRSEIDRVTALNTDLTRQLEIERNEVKAKREEIIATKEEVVSMKEQAMRSKETSMVALDRLQVIFPFGFALYCGRVVLN
jgi:multidrug resistance efflux pump